MLVSSGVLIWRWGDGCAGCGALWSVLFVLETALRGGQPSFPSLNALLGVRYEVAQMLNAVPDAIISSMIFFLMLFLLRVLLRNQWIEIGRASRREREEISH